MSTGTPVESPVRGTRTPGSEGGSGKRSGRKAATAPRVDPYVRHEALPVRAGCETPTPGCRGSPGKLRAV